MWKKKQREREADEYGDYGDYGMPGMGGGIGGMGGLGGMGGGMGNYGAGGPYGDGGDWGDSGRPYGGGPFGDGSGFASGGGIAHMGGMGMGGRGMGMGGRGGMGMGGGRGRGRGGLDYSELEAVIERFHWQSYPQHLQNTLFHAERLDPLRKKTLQQRLEQAYEFKGRGDAKVEDQKYRDAIIQYEYAYGLFKYCEKRDRKITMKDDAKSAREMRAEELAEGHKLEDNQLTRFWLQVDEMLTSCCVMIAMCKANLKNPAYEDALAAVNEALEIKPHHAPAYFRRSQIHEKLEMWSEAVDDARNAYRYAPEDFKFDLWKHREHMVQLRREASFFWTAVGFVADAPYNLATLPWTLLTMSAYKQALLVLALALALGAKLYGQTPEGAAHLSQLNAGGTAALSLASTRMSSTFHLVTAQGGAVLSYMTAPLRQLWHLRSGKSKGTGDDGTVGAEAAKASTQAEQKAEAMHAAPAPAVAVADVNGNAPPPKKRRGIGSAIKNIFTLGGLIGGKQVPVKRVPEGSQSGQGWS
jgi:tetratricopeptide (TPR) repeat protein